LAEREVLAAPLDQAERGRVPEQRRAAVRHQHFVPVGQCEQLGDPLADAMDDALHAGLAVARAHQPGAGRRQGGQCLGPHLRRPAAEPAVARAQVVGQSYIRRANIGTARVGHCVSMAAMGRISQRIGAIAESATLAIDAKAKALKAAGQDVIGFGAGEPDFPTPDHIVAAAREACTNPTYHHYTPVAGLPDLRAAIAAKTSRDSGYDVTPAQVLVTNG